MPRGGVEARTASWHQDAAHPRLAGPRRGRDTAAAGTIVWNPWKPPAQTCSSALPPAAQIRLAKATASSRNTSALPTST